MSLSITLFSSDSLPALGINTDGVRHCIFTTRPGTLRNDFFFKLLDMSMALAPKSPDTDVFEDRDLPIAAPSGPQPASI